MNKQNQIVTIIDLIYYGENARWQYESDTQQPRRLHPG